ncbi:MAG: oxidoreductase domain protein [Bacilli bacterium]|nr:oxidoreductase domain protein [Bacilli bacterium]
MKVFQAALVGIGGFGKTHTGKLVQLASSGVLKCVAFTETNIEANRDSYEKLSAIGARHYYDFEEMLHEHPELDFVVIATPIALHQSMGRLALEHGCHVLMEKPPAVTIQDMDALIAAAKRSGKRCQIQFQNTCGQAFQVLLSKLNEGIIGEVQSITGVGMWKRTDSYYERTSWAGKLTHNGDYILDGTLNNPFSHLLNNCLLAAGAGDASRARPQWVQAELYKGHPIEGEDTSCVKIGTETGAEVRFYSTLCHTTNEEPYIAVQGTNGKIIWGYKNTLDFVDNQGNQHQDLFPEEDLILKMYMNLMQAIEDETVQLYSSVEACRNFVLATNGAFESSKETHAIAAEHLIKQQEDKTIATYIPTIDGIIRTAVENGLLFSEMDVKWSVKTDRFSLDHYEEFKLF